MKAALQTHKTNIIIIIIIIVIIFITITRSLSRQVHSLFQSEFFKQRNQLLPRSVLKQLLVSLMSTRSTLRLLPRFPVTSPFPCTFPSITRFRRQFFRKM
jgi:hypothetical protein